MTDPSHIARRAYRAALKFERVLRSAGPAWVVRRTWQIWRDEGLRGLRLRVPAARRVPKAASPSVDGGLLREIVTQDCRSVVPDGPVCIIAHVFYAERFPELVEALAGLGFAYTLCVSVTNTRDRDQVAGLARERLPRAELDVRVVDNRGRDIAPLLVTFADRLRAAQYVCHVHTKKSLYTGREQHEWRTYLIDALIGNPQQLGRIFQQFRQHSEVGIIYPEMFASVPHWGVTWRANRSIAQAVAARLGITELDTYPEFPAGSMFWARSAALRPLLELGLQLSDFPKETGQTDGTLQHTLERFFALSARRAGFELRVMDVDAGDATVFSNVGDKNLSGYYSEKMHDRIVLAAVNASLVSFDLFDTLLVHPFANPGSLRDYAGALQQDAEHALLRPRSEVCRAARTLHGRGLRLALIVDTDLTRAFVQQLLKAHDLDIFDDVFVSSETGLRKDTGAVWRDLPARLRVAPERWLHVGDDEYADIQRAIEALLRPPAHVMRAIDIFHHWNEGAGLAAEPKNWQESFLLGLLALRFTEALDRTAAATDAFAARVLPLSDLSDVGYCVFGPQLACAPNHDLAGLPEVEEIRAGARAFVEECTALLGPRSSELHEGSAVARLARAQLAARRWRLATEHPALAALLVAHS